MGYATTYATPEAEVLEATWTAAASPSAGAIEIRPYPTASPQGGGGFAIPAPPPNPLDTFDDLGGTRYLDTSGNPQWMPTAEDRAFYRRNRIPAPGIDYDRLDGLDGSYAGRPVRPTAPAIGRAAGSSLDDVIGQMGGRVALGAGGVVSGAMAGIGEYRSGGGVASAAAVGIGAGVGSVAGAVIGGIAGSALGPVGTAVGGAVGGALGGAIGQLIGDALVPDANLNGAQVLGVTAVGNSAVAYNIKNYTQNSFGVEEVNFSFNVTGPFAITEVATFFGSNVIVNFIISGPNIIPGTVPKMIKEQYFVTWQTVYQYKNGRYTIQRLDGQNDPTAYDPNSNPNRPATGTPDFRLPEIDLPRPRPNPRPRPRPYPDPIGDPTRYPDPTFDPTGYPYPDPLPGPTDDPAPYPDPDPDPETCDPCAKLDQLLELLQPPVTGDIDLTPCKVGEDEPEPNLITVPDGSTGLSGLSAKVDLALDGLEQLWNLLKCPEPPTVAPIPDAWEIKKLLNCPQLVITLKKPGDKSSYRRSFSIPHPTATEESICKNILNRRYRYDYGNHLSMVLYRDNSKLQAQVKDRAEGEQLLSEIEPLINPDWIDMDFGQWRHVENAGRDIIPATVEFHTVAYYPNGRKSNIPDWFFTIPE